MSVVVGFPPGGPIDYVARVLAPPLGDALGTIAMVENRPGAGGAIAAVAVSRATVAGSALLLAPGSTVTVQPHLHAGAVRDAVTRLLPISLVGSSPLSIVVASDHPARSFPELIAWLARHPRLASCGDAGLGTIAHLATAELSRKTGVPLTSVHYRGVPDEISALMEGSLKVMMAVPGVVDAFRASGRVRLLATTGADRWALVPDVPTMREYGVDLVAHEWVGLFAPSAIPADAAESVWGAMARTLDLPGIRAALSRYGLERGTLALQDFSALIRREREHWGAVVAAAGIKAES